VINQRDDDDDGDDDDDDAAITGRRFDMGSIAVPAMREAISMRCNDIMI
jgi:hypothetical protein